MDKKLLLLMVSIVMTIAYIDLVDSFRHFEQILSDMIKPESGIKIETETKIFKTQR